MQIISASRRTDIPAFYARWFMNRIRAGSVRYPNPFSNEVYTVSLLPEDVHSIVFWTKYGQPFLPHVDELLERGYRFYCHYTISGAPESLEPHVPSWEEAVLAFRELARRTSPRHVQWRFDPILLTGELDAGYYVVRFRDIATALAGATERCYFSFVSFYGKVRRRLVEVGIRAVDPSVEQKLALTEALADIAGDCDMTLYSCCQEALAGGRVQKASCVDGDLLAALFPDRPRVKKRQPSRDGCGCVASRDIGMYDTCPYGCVYCYANQSHEAALAWYRAHDPKGEMLIER
jgi:DNA repair photolyase